MIELKRAEGHEKVIGQFQYYRNWVKENLEETNGLLRGIIIRNKISDDLKLACKDLPDVKPIEYSISTGFREKTN